MVNALLILAAETAEKSETPFFIIGCLFGAWAVVIGVLGSRSASFASTRGAGTAIVGTSFVFAVAAMATSLYVA